MLDNEGDKTSIQLSNPVETFEYDEAAAMGLPGGMGEYVCAVSDHP